MRAALKLECINDNLIALNRAFEGTLMDMKPRRPWCAKLTEYDPSADRFTREFVDSQKDYSKANSKGSRGVSRYYWLEKGAVYEIHELTSWKRSRRWFAGVSDEGEVVEIKREDAILCLS